MEPLERQKTWRARSAARRWLSREVNNTLNVVSNEVVTEREIELCLDTLQKRMNNLETIQSEVELLIDEEDMEKDMDEAEEFINRYNKTRIVAEEKIMSLCINSDHRGIEEDMIINPNVNLPKLDLPKFTGDPLDFFSFWERFRVAVDATKIPDVNKFIYLKSVLDKDALAAVKGLSVTPGNYHVAKDLLKDRFGRKEKVIFHHVESLLNFKDLKNSKDVKELWAFRDEIYGHIRSLHTLGITGEQYGVFLTPIILNKLPVEIRTEWARSEGKESDIDFLMNFLYEELRVKERSMMFQRQTVPLYQEPISVRHEQKGWQSRKTAATFLTQNKHACVICDKMHRGNPEECFRFLKSSKSERVKIIKSKHLCFACLDQNHQAKTCKRTCKVCHGKHHELICNSADGQKPDTGNNANSNPGHSSDLSEQVINHALIANKQCNTVLQMLKVRVRGVAGNKDWVNVLLDGGSDHTYVTSEVIKRIQPRRKGEVEMAFASFGFSRPSPSKTRSVYTLDLESENGHIFKLDATEIQTICTPVYRPKLPAEALSFVKNFPIGEDYESDDLTNIDILIGMDYLWSVLKGETISIPGTNLVIQRSVFGWVVSGSFRCEITPKQHSMVSNQLHCCEQHVSHFQNLWDLDSIGVSVGEHVVEKDEDVQILQNFENSITFEEGSYSVKLPWKSNCKENLMNNKSTAKARLNNLMKRLKDKPQLLSGYLEVFEEMEREGIIREVPTEKENEGHPIFYLPHHPVVKETSLTTKIRPVFDASCPGVNGVALNDCLLSGPCLLPDLVAVLLRFRRWPIALTADVKQAFLNIRVYPEDTDVHRFLLPQPGGASYKTMKFVRVPFGNKSSPFLLNATVKHHLSKYAETTTVKELKENLYVDDWLTGCNTTDECVRMVEEANDVMNSASLPLAKWASNHNEVNERLEEMSQKKNCLIIKDNAFKVLGVQWNRETDSLVFEGLIMDIKGCPTKRAVLSLIARLFDPLGLLSPFIMMLKILFQDIWRVGLEWDQLLPALFRDRLDMWMEGLIYLKRFQVRRCYFDVQWNSNSIKGLYCFCDASLKAYGACVYLTIGRSDGSFSSVLVYSKSKVAPLKSVSLPRLELLGALLAARIVVFVKTSLNLSDKIPCVCYTDSMIALAWIKGNPTRWRTFVSNRVTEIQRLTHKENWFHVSGMENPADMISRGVPGETLVASEFWLYGPKWLGHEVPREEIDENGVTADDVEVDVMNQLVVQTETLMVFDCSKWSTCHKAIRVVAWVLRFIHNAKRPLENTKGGLKVLELRCAEVKLVQHAQRLAYTNEVNQLIMKGLICRSSSILNLNPFIDDDGLLRTKRRLEFSELDYDEKCPIILPRCALSILLIGHYHISMKHAGVDTMITAIRSKYWIVGLRKQAKRVKSSCITCQIQDSAPCCQITAPLPPQRVKRAPVFSICGIDYAGPLFCSDCPKKLYVLLFTCAVVRAVHVELVESLLVDDFMLAFIRFVCRRSLPKQIISDNAKTFVCAKERLINHYGPSCPQWKFNAPLSPWWGAFWERMVRSIKSNLRKSVGNKQLTRRELETTLLEVESCVNSRPLTFVGDSIDSVQPLTPSHFLTPEGSSGMHDPLSGVPPKSDRWTLCEEYSNRCRSIDLFWQRWSAEYLRNLPCLKTGRSKGNPTVGTLVMIKENEHMKRLQWPIGVITKLFPGRDGLVRAVEVNTSKGKVTRPVQRIYVLEASERDDSNIPELTMPTNNVVVT